MVESILPDPEALAERLRGAKANKIKKHQSLYDCLDIVTSQLEESKGQLS
jgi:hypothetical protein